MYCYGVVFSVSSKAKASAGKLNASVLDIHGVRAFKRDFYIGGGSDVLYGDTLERC